MNFLQTYAGLIPLRGFDPEDKDNSNLKLEDGVPLYIPENSYINVIRTSYQKMYLPETKRYNPQKYLDDKFISKYLNQKVEKKLNTHPVGSVFTMTYYTYDKKANQKVEEYPGWAMLNKKTSDIQQDKFDNFEAFIRAFTVSLRGMYAFDFFTKYNVDVNDYVDVVTKAYKMDKSNHRRFVTKVSKGRF